MKDYMKKKMKKTVYCLLILSLATFIKTGLVIGAVQNTPHNVKSLFPATRNETAGCDPCHESGRKDGQNPRPEGGTGEEGFDASMCMWCHSNAAYGASVLIEASFSEKYVFPGFSLGTRSHGLSTEEPYKKSTENSGLSYTEENSNLIIVSGYGYDREAYGGLEGFECTTCHNVHSNDLSRPFLKESLDDLCTKCHETDDTHPDYIDAKIVTDDDCDDCSPFVRLVREGFEDISFTLQPFDDFLGNTDGFIGDKKGRWNLGRHTVSSETGTVGRITCVTCHAVHGVQKDSDANSPILLPNENLLAFDDLINRSSPVKVSGKNCPDLIEAALNGDTKEVKRLIDDGCDINISKDKLGMKVMSIAAKEGHLEIVKCLIDSGVDVNAEYKYRETALIIAARAGQKDVVKYLVGVGADVHAKYEHNLSAMSVAAYAGNLDVVRVILEVGVDIDARCKDIAIVEAARHNNNEVVKILLDKGAHITGTYNKNELDLLDAAAAGRYEDVKDLLDKRTDINTKDFIGWTPLMNVAIYGHYDVAKLLIDNGADVNVKNDKGITALKIAVRFENNDIIKLLKEAGAKE